MNAGLSLAAAMLAALSIATCSRNDGPLMGETAPGAPATEAPVERPADAEVLAAQLPAGEYRLDKLHSSLTFKVSHLGFSDYVGQFRSFDATMQLDPANPAGATLTATIDVGSLLIPPPPEGFLDELLSAKWLNAVSFPQITFTSKSIEMTGVDTAKVLGDLTFNGRTKPVELRAKFNGGYASHPYEQAARIGFSAVGSFKRSDFGVSEGVPAPNSKMGVGDEVKFSIETEFNGPASAASPQPAN
jgi:polyisoprenoid-binding protein YceI